MNWVKKTGRKLNKTALIAALVHFAVSFFSDRLIFTYAWLDASTAKQLLRSIETIGVKIAFLIMLIALWQAAFWVASHVERRYLKVAGGYMLFMTALLLLTWPGIWRMDEFGILSSSVQLFPHFWQNYITSVFYILALMLLPFPAGVIIVQCACISVIVARVVKLCTDEYRGRGGITWVLLMVPFFMFPVLDSNLYPMRMSLYAFLEVLLIAELFFLAKHVAEGREPDGGEKTRMFYITLLAAVVTVWRTEAVYYVVVYPLLLLLIGKGRRFLKQIMIYIIVFVILFAPQKIGEKLTSGQQYELTSVVLPLVPLIEAADENGDAGDRELLAVIDQVVNVELTLQKAAEGKSGINMFWGEPEFQREYTPEQFAQFKSAFYRLALKHWQVFLEERWTTFCDSSDLLENTTLLFSAEGVPNYEAFREYPLSGPVSDRLRTSVIKILELRSSDNYDVKLAITDYVYSPIPSILFLAVVAVLLALKRKWTTLALVLSLSVKVPLIFLTAPSRLFMYYYSVYLFGYCVLFYAIYYLIMEKKTEMSD